MHGYRRGGTFDSPKVPKSDLGLRPKDPVALLRWIQKAFFCEKSLPYCTQTGLIRYRRCICPLPTSPASGEGDALPFPANRQPR